tara:strand:- start:10085 stop:11251 length:1167 start_codon:yes stop_codon:yes gene_type:complete
MHALLKNKTNSSIQMFIDASNIGSGGGINHLKNILENAPLSIKERNLEIHVWVKELIKSNLPQQRNIFYHSSQLFKLPTPLNFLWNLTVFRFLCMIKKPDYIFCPGGLIFFKHNNSTIIFQNVLPFLDKEINRYGFFMRIKLNLVRLMLIISSKKSQKQIFHSENSKQIISSNISSRLSKVIPHGLDLAFYKSDMKFKTYLENLHYKIENNVPLRFTYVSSGELYKNHEDLLKSFSYFKEKKQDFILNLVVAGGSCSESILKKIEESHIRTNINLYNQLITSELINLIHDNTDIYLIASSCETFGLNLIEGMGSRVCVISNNASCMPEVSGKDANFFDVHDHKSLFNSVENLKKNQNLISKSIQSNLDKVNEYNWKAVSKRTFDFIIG